MGIFDKIFGLSQKTLDRLRDEAKKELENERLKQEMEEQKIAEQKAEEERLAARVEEERQVQIQLAAEKLNEDKMNSDEPWVEMVGESVDPEKGIKVELNWNPAFIKYLREGGIQGASEEECAQRWLAMVAQDVDSRVGDHDNDGKDDSEFE